VPGRRFIKSGRLQRSNAIVNRGITGKIAIPLATLCDLSVSRAESSLSIAGGSS
jgi:hypothetical protein